MKILFLTDKLYPCFDGIGDYTYLLAKEFAEEGHEVAVICTNQKKISDFDYEKEAGIKVFSSIDSWSWKNFSTIYKTIKSQSPDFLFLQYNPYGFSHYGIPFIIPSILLLLKLNGIKLCTTFHELAIRFNPLTIKTFIIGFLQRIICNSIHILSNRSITSIELYSEYIYVFKNKLKLIPIGCNIDDGRIPHKGKTEIQEPTLTYFGSNPRGLFAVPEILKKLKDFGFQANFLFIGKFKKKVMDEIVGKAKEYGLESKIRFTGYLSATEAMEHLRKATIYLGLLENEGITLKSGSVAAAFCAGLPVIATQGDMTDEYFFKHNQNCILVDNNAEEIAGEIIKLKSDSNKLKDLAKASRKSYDQHLSWNSIYNQYCKHLNLSL